ncbi:hypothetical protein NAEX_01593 [Nannocystis exedens]|nr:hypothetical protein NAEX_01593 [Nannocystis exedens]
MRAGIEPIALARPNRPCGPRLIGSTRTSADGRSDVDRSYRARRTSEARDRDRSRTPLRASPTARRTRERRRRRRVLSSTRISPAPTRPRPAGRRGRRGHEGRRPLAICKSRTTPSDLASSPCRASAVRARCRPRYSARRSAINCASEATRAATSSSPTPTASRSATAPRFLPRGPEKSSSITAMRGGQGAPVENKSWPCGAGACRCTRPAATESDRSTHFPSRARPHAAKSSPSACYEYSRERGSAALAGRRDARLR